MVSNYMIIHVIPDALLKLTMMEITIALIVLPIALFVIMLSVVFIVHSDGM
jgi:hypothetical protein